MNKNNNDNKIVEIDFINKLEEKFKKFESKFKELTNFIEKEGKELKYEINKLKKIKEEKTLIKLV